MEINIPFLGCIEIYFHIGYKNKVEKEVCDVYKKTGNKIRAIKTYRKMTGKSIRESKENTDELLNKYNL